MTTSEEKPAIEMVPVESSQIHSIGYHADSRTLAVKFHRSEGVYHYADVPPEKHAALMAAESKGKHLGQHIKGKHEFVRHAS